MKLQDFATPLVAKNHFIKASFGGFQGSGKSYTATNFIIGVYKDLNLSKPILILDNEKGGRFLINIFKKAGIKALVKDTKQLADVKASFEYLQSGEIDFLFIDSLTKIYYQYVRDYKTKNRRQSMYLQDWGKLLPAWQEEFSDHFVDVEGNIVFTGRGGFEYEKEEDEKDDQGNVIQKGQFVKSGLKMKIAGETPYETDLNIWMQLEKVIEKNKPNPIQKNVAYVLKDRSDTINAKIFVSPKYSNFRPVIKFIKGLEVGEVPGESFTDNFAPGDDYSYLRERTLRQIQIELIEGLFDKNGLGDARSKADKILKTNIIEKVFSTTSKTEIAKMDSADLEFKRKLLSNLFSALNKAKPEVPILFIKNFQTLSAA